MWCAVAGWAALDTQFGAGMGAAAAQRGSLAPVPGFVEPLEGSRASGFGVLLRGKIPLQNIYLKTERQLAVADLSVSGLLSPSGAGGDADRPGRN